MENTEINGAMYIDSSELDKLFASSSSGHTAHSPGVSLWSSGTVGSGLVSVSPMTRPSGSLYFIDPNQNEWDPFKEILVTYSEDEVLNKILNEMADELTKKWSAGVRMEDYDELELDSWGEEVQERPKTLDEVLDELEQDVNPRSTEIDDTVYGDFDADWVVDEIFIDDDDLKSSSL